MSQDDFEFGRVNDVQCDGFLMQQTDIECERFCLMSDSLSNECVIDGLDFDWWGAWLDGYVILCDNILTNQIQSGSRVNYRCQFKRQRVSPESNR